MLKRNLLLLLALVLVIIGFVLGWNLRPPIYETSVVTRTVLKTRTLQLKGKETIRTVYVPPEGSVSVEPKDPNKPLEDVVKIKVKTWGLTARPGFFYNAVGNEIGLDLKIGYLNRIGLAVSPLALPVRSMNAVVFAPQISLSYRLDGMTRQVLMNSEAALGYRPLSQQLMVGFRINL